MKIYIQGEIMKKKLISALLAGMMAVSAFALTGCDGTGKLDETKTHLFVGVYDGGFGADSWEKMEKDFEALYATESFETDKVGVDVHITPKKAEFLGDNLKNTIANNKEDLYFTNANLRDFITSDLVVDITDVVTQTTNEKFNEVYADNQTIEAKMIEDIRDYDRGYDPAYYTSNGQTYKYYGVPVFVSTASVIYDVDLWEDRQLYFTREYELEGVNADAVWTSGLTGDAEIGYGQDGIKGTLDDGLPRTWEDYKLMLDQVYGVANCMPLTFSGANPMYSREFFVQLYANYEGYDEFRLNMTFDGTYTGTIQDPNEEVTVTPQTGYLVFKQRGRLKCAEFGQYIAQKKYFASDVTSSETHTGTQDNFLYSAIQENNKTKRIAMLIEGNWWEHEAQDTVNTIANKYPQYANRRFGVMTFPWMDEYANTTSKTMVSIQPDSYAFIAKRTKYVDLAKKFLAFTTQDYYLSYYTSVSGAPRPFKYTIKDEHYENMSYYKKSVWEMYKGVIDGSTKFVNARSNNPISRYSKEFVYSDWGFQAAISDMSITEPISGFHYNGSRITPADYAMAPYNKYAAVWKSNYYDAYFAS